MQKASVFVEDGNAVLCALQDVCVLQVGFAHRLYRTTQLDIGVLGLDSSTEQLQYHPKAFDVGCFFDGNLDGPIDVVGPIAQSECKALGLGVFVDGCVSYGIVWGLVVFLWGGCVARPTE